MENLNNFAQISCHKKNTMRKCLQKKFSFIITKRKRLFFVLELVMNQIIIGLLCSKQFSQNIIKILCFKIVQPFIILFRFLIKILKDQALDLFESITQYRKLIIKMYIM